MRLANLRHLDLNILVVVEAVLRERNLTRAARGLHMSQPAVSHTLARARSSFGDQLLVRSGNTMLLTPRGAELAGQLARVLGDLSRVLEPPLFDPSRCSEKVAVNATEGAVVGVLCDMLAGVSKMAPMLEVVVSNSMSDSYSGLRTGAVDLVVDVAIPPLPLEFRQRPLFSNTLVCVTRRGFWPNGVATVGAYVSATHVTISGGTDEVVSAGLEERGIRRLIGWTFSGFVTAASVVASSDLVMTVPQALGDRLIGLYPLEVVACPVELPEVTLSMVWHQRDDNNPILGWLIDQIVANSPV
jgi:DNA-binding transcriptional LysR family regulator